MAINHGIFKKPDYPSMYSYHLTNTFICMHPFLCISVPLSPKLAFHYARIVISYIKKYFVGVPN